MNRNTRLVAVLAVALLAATVASFVVYRALAAGSGPQQPQTIDTLVAAQSIPSGTMLTRDHVKVVQWPASSRLDGSLSDPRTVIDRGAIVAIAANEPITESKLAAQGAGAGLPPTIPPGMRAMSVRVNEVVGVAGFVVPGTRVDVLVTFESRTQASESVARVVVSNVQVLTAGTRFDQEKARQDNRPIPTSVVTLLVTPEDAQRLALAAAEGRITLILRNPLDNAPTESAGIRAGGLMGNPTPPPPVAAPRSAPKPSAAAAPAVPPPPPPPAPYTVEAIRGAKRTTEPVKNEEEEKPRDVPPSQENPQVMTCVFALSTLLLPGVLSLAPGAQTPPPAPAPGAAATVPAQSPVPASDRGRLDRDRVLMLTAGRSMVLTTAYDITRIAITDPKIADAVVVQPREVLIDGRSAGTVSLIVWGAGRREQYDVVVDPGVTTLQQTLQQIFPGEDIRVAINDDAVILSGQVSTNAVMLKAAEVVAATKANAKRRQHAAAARRHGQPAGDAAGALRRGESRRADGGRHHVLRQRAAVRRPDHDAAVLGTRCSRTKTPAPARCSTTSSTCSSSTSARASARS